MENENNILEIKPIMKFYSKIYKEEVFGIWNGGWLHNGMHILFFYEQDLAKKFLEIASTNNLNAQLKRAHVNTLNLLNLYYFKPAVITTIERRNNPTIKYDKSSKEIEHILINKEDLS